MAHLKLDDADPTEWWDNTRRAWLRRASRSLAFREPLKVYAKRRAWLGSVVLPPDPIAPTETKETEKEKKKGENEKEERGGVEKEKKKKRGGVEKKEKKKRKMMKQDKKEKKTENKMEKNDDEQEVVWWS